MYAIKLHDYTFNIVNHEFYRKKYKTIIIVSCVLCNV